MTTHFEAANDLKRQIHEAFPDLTPEQVKVDELSGISMIDVILPEYKAAEEWVNIEVHIMPHGGVQYGFSIVDKDTGYGERPDCGFCHGPTMLKYMKRLFPLQRVAL